MAAQLPSANAKAKWSDWRTITVPEAEAEAEAKPSPRAGYKARTR